MADGINSEDLENLRNYWRESAEAQKRASESLKGYQSILKQIKEIRRNLNYLAQQEAKYTDELKKLEKEHANLLKKKLKDSKNFTKEDQKRLDTVKQTIVNRQKELNIIKKETSELKEQSKVIAESANSANLMSAAFSSMGKGLVGIGKKLYEQKGYLLEQQKAVKETELSMGILSKQADAFRGNIYKASLATNAIGVDTKQLAQIQGSYSEQVGRSVQLTQEGLEAMAELSKGTILGADGAAELAANMESFGINAVGTKKIVEDMLDTAHKMGVNSAKVTKNLQKNLKLANRYHFKDGVKGISRMAAAAAKFKIDMDSIAGMADKVFRPEGAVEMAARLQTMGGEFAKMADPFTLMFKARNDFEGFTMDIVNATKDMAKFNEETGEFDFSGLALDRMREIADITGISAEELANMSKEAVKFDRIQSEMSAGLTEENQEFLAGIAQYDKDKNEWYAMVGKDRKSLKTLSDGQIETIKAEKQNLKERAKQAQTFDETWENIKNTFKATLLPLLEGISKGLQKPMQDFLNWINESGGFEKLAEFGEKIGKTIGDFVTWGINFVKDNPFTSLVSVIAGMGLFKAAQWIFNGRMLAMGFNSAASVGGGGGGLFDMLGGRGRKGKLGLGSKLFKGIGNTFGGKKTMVGRSFRGMSAASAKGWGGIKGIGAGLGLGLGGMGLDAWRGSLEDPESGLGKGLGVGSSALTGAGLGAIGGPIGMLIGGLIGAGYGALKEFAGPSGNEKDYVESLGAGGYIESFDDVIVRAGQPPIGINPADDVIAMKKDGPVDKVLGNGGGNMKVTFGGPIKIEGTLNLVSPTGEASVNLDDPHLLRDLSNMIQQELSKSIGGGKNSSNPA